MQDPAERKNYNFLYELKQKNLRPGFKAACQSVEAIQGLDIANIEASQLLSGVWVKFTNTREDDKLNQLRQAKWVLRFPRGNQAINEAWQKLVPLVKENKLWDIKAAAKSEDHETQVICVYVADFLNIEEIVDVYARLKECGALKLHMDQEFLNRGSINYITDANTAVTGKNKKVTPSITDSEIKELYDLRQQKGSLDASIYRQKWNALAGILKVKIIGNEPLNNETTTYFSRDESNHRLELVMRIDKLQKELSLSNFEEVDMQCRMLRQFLTGNYRLTTVELLKSVKELLNVKQPNIGYISSLFKKDLLSQAYCTVIKFLDNQIKIEETREHIARKGPQESLTSPQSSVPK